MLDRSHAHAPLYRPELESDACGVGLVADADGRRSHAVVERALEALRRLAHRGAAWSMCPDGAGILTQIPWTLLERELPVRARTASGSRMVGMFFLPAGSRELIAPAIERTLSDAGWRWLRWRPVPIQASRLHSAARLSMPDIWQLVAAADRRLPDADRALHGARLRIERQAGELGLRGLSVVSLSTSTVVYKGLVTPGELPDVFPDLQSSLFESALAIVHQRFSTNTAPEWRLAQPFRMLAHNGEINTIHGNRIWMRARARDARCLGAYAGEGVLDETGSDSQSLDEAVELLRHAGLSLAHAISRLVPPAWEQDSEIPPEVAAFHAYQACFAEPWDGPAALAFTDGRVIGAALDRNGFRPLRYLKTADRQLLLGSEAGIFDVPDTDVTCRGRVGPGELIVVDTVDGTVRETTSVRKALARQRPYRQLLARTVVMPQRTGPPLQRADAERGETLVRLQRAFGYTREEVEMILRVMADQGEEAVGSMGDDAPIAPLSAFGRTLPDYFRQRFAQVTNPPMDPLREACVMSLRVLLGPRGGFLSDDPPAAKLLSLPSPILNEAQFDAVTGTRGVAVVRLPILFPASRGAEGLETALDRLVDLAAAAVERGAAIVALSDRNVDEAHAPIPPLLATAAVHHGLAARGCRLRAAIVVETGEARDPHQLATLFAYGASAAFPYLAGATVAALAPRGSAADAVERYRRALERGLLRIFSKMGVSTFSGYCGGQLFEALGLDRALVDRYFPGTASPLGGLTLTDLASQVLDRHREAFGANASTLGHPGMHTYRRDGEYHANNPVVVRQLHRAAGSASDEAYGAFARLVEERPATSLRDLLSLPAAAQPVSLGDVESVDRICRRFFASAMSIGALSPEAHRTVAIAMNRLGGRSNSGEGGEEPARFDRTDDWSGSAIKQIASARFGVTPGYLISADELQIKIGQGSKPGEGGQLPAVKVVEHIARLRYAQPGITLISPPVHHDIYSIEDLAQLIFDLKRFHPAARVSVKLVAQTGIGIVAAGVVKAGADTVLVGGHDGGTGASPRASIKYVGSPWELGLAEVRQVLEQQGLRRQVRLQVEGGLKIGRDVVIAAALGADEFGFGTAALVAIGCVMARQCHLNTCPVGIATQRPDLRERFAGTPDMLIAYFRMLAQDVRRALARAGFRRLEDLVGRADLLDARPAKLDLQPLLARVRVSRMDPHPAEPASRPAYPSSSSEAVDHVSEQQLAHVNRKRALEVVRTIRNTDRAVGARLAGRIAARSGDAGLQEGSIRMRLSGSAGQSFGAFLLPGISLHLTGEANDYVGKGMHGGEIVIRPGRTPRSSSVSVLAGNTALYGATGGRLFIAGSAGERFAIRNSGATAVVEGVGDHACEYMTGGCVVVLGSCGRNFAAGMSGGIAFVCDEDGRFPARYNRSMVDAVPLEEDDWSEVSALLAAHCDLTSSRTARRMLDAGPEAALGFWKVVPKNAPSRRPTIAEPVVASLAPV